MSLVIGGAGKPAPRTPIKVLFGVPSYRGLECIPFLDSLRDTVLLFTKHNIECKLEVVLGSSYVQVARNTLVDKFLRSDYDKLFFLDEDISWEPEGALALVKAGKPITGGVYTHKVDRDMDIPFPVVLKCSEEGVPLCDGPYLRAVRSMTGFMCIDRFVFDNIKHDNPRLEYTTRGETKEEIKVQFDFFPQGVYNREWVGEDFAFCDLWSKGFGGEIAIIPNITFGHHKSTKSWYGNLHEYIKQLPGGIDYGKESAEKTFWSDEDGGNSKTDVTEVFRKFKASKTEKESILRLIA